MITTRSQQHKVDELKRTIHELTNEHEISQDNVTALGNQRDVVQKELSLLQQELDKIKSEKQSLQVRM